MEIRCLLFGHRFLKIQNKVKPFFSKCKRCGNTYEISYDKMKKELGDE